MFFVLITLVVPLAAFEAHIVNVTATIERKPCLTYEIRSMGYWKNHPSQRIFPQTVGDTTVANNAEADAVFNLPNNVLANKLKKQLLALKFDIAYFGSGEAIVGGGDSTTLSQLAAQADAALLADPQVSDTLAYYHNLIEEINTSETVSTCDQFFLLCGDINADGVINMPDVTVLINYLFSGGSIPTGVKTDLNGDGVSDVFDQIALSDYLGGQAPAPTCESEPPPSEPANLGASILDAVSPEGDTGLEGEAGAGSEAVPDQTESSTSTSTTNETPVDSTSTVPDSTSTMPVVDPTPTSTEPTPPPSDTTPPPADPTPPPTDPTPPPVSDPPPAS
ncbi:MAG: hypothetical protein HY093_04650 [Candidatus Liptonbacteria bacterium]|nr:hypothetical protein [Candidatus Liptonbacteria bacterium]